MVQLGNAAPAEISPSFDEQQSYLRVRPVVGALRYELRVHFGPMDSAGGPVLSVDLDQFTAAGTFEATQVQLWELEPPSVYSGGGLVATLASRDCSVKLEAGGARGSLSCGLAPTDSGLRSDTTQVEASWQATAVTIAAGQPMRVTWALGERYVSSGTATVWPDLTLDAEPSLYWVPDVRLRGDPFAPEYLRILIRGYSGDGTYGGDSVDPSIQDAHGDSPNIVTSSIPLAVAHPRTAVNTGPREDQLWTPIFGPCTATISDGGATGTVRCEADPEHRVFPEAGSTTLEASWGPAPG